MGQRPSVLAELEKIKDFVGKIVMLPPNPILPDPNNCYTKFSKPADCVVFDAPDALEVIRLRATRRWVIRRGNVIAETTPARTVLNGEPVTFRP